MIYAFVHTPTQLVHNIHDPASPVSEGHYRELVPLDLDKVNDAGVGLPHESV